MRQSRELRINTGSAYIAGGAGLITGSTNSSSFKLPASDLALQGSLRAPLFRTRHVRQIALRLLMTWRVYIILTAGFQGFTLHNLKIWILWSAFPYECKLFHQNKIAAECRILPPIPGYSKQLQTRLSVQF
jgi:hypothetical protein